MNNIYEEEEKPLSIHDIKTRKIEEVERKKMISLDLADCRLDSVPISIFKLTHLVNLKLGDWNEKNNIEEIPKEINQLKNLEYLTLANNELKKIPEEILHLKKLKGLSIGRNQITELPKEIVELENLEVLDVRENRLKTLPKELFKMRNLRGLYLSGNQITSIPEEICMSKKLKELILDENPIEIPPPEITWRGISAIKNYFVEFQRKEQKDYLYEIKILLVGEGGVGKTSIAKSLTIPGYELEDEQRTEGIDVKSWIIPAEELDLNKGFRLNIWDFGGQEIYHATHQFFLTKRSLYLLVTESRREDRHEDFYYWLNIIKLLGDKSPVIIVLNKCDQPVKDLPIKEYSKFFNNIAHFDKTSCKKEYKNTIESLKNTIKEIITNKDLLPHIGTPLPKVWVDIRAELEKLKQKGKDYISCDEYFQICKYFGMDEQRALYLSDFFHDIGMILHFQDDLNLRETVILNPEWVTKGVYKVLDNTIVKLKYGVFDDRDLIYIWQDEKYRNKRKELLSLMKDKKFELCYELENGKYLAPQLLPADEIDFEWRTKENNLHFEYRYMFIPKGILSRIIVKRHKDIYKKTHWKYGVLLEYENTRAIIREKYFDRKINITLEGSNKKEFLTIIRKTIQDIHGDFKNLEVKEMVPCNCIACKESDRPYFYEYELLKKYEIKGEKSIKCHESLEDVSVEKLLGEVIIPSEEKVLKTLDEITARWKSTF